jgi:outer membrane scaffolding protein for murein synthesis (MipA/OmpV family)
LSAVRYDRAAHLAQVARLVPSYACILKRCARLRAGPKFALVAIMLGACAPRVGFSQTPSPLQEWQYSGGITLYKLFEPTMPEWRIEAGAAVESRPSYEGSKTYRELGGPMIDVRYRDIAFVSVGDGLGVNLIRGENYRAGITIGYDLGRLARDDLTHLKGLGDISAAPVVKLFGSYAISKDFPLVLRADVRQFVGGADGLAGDLDAYVPLPGSSETLAMFAGPSVTFANRLFMQTVFGVSPNQALASGYPDYLAHGGAKSAGFGFSATRFIEKHWLINADVAVNRLLGSASESPITQTKIQSVLAVSVAYRW